MIKYSIPLLKNCCLLFLTLLFVACSPSFQEINVEDIPIEVMLPDSQVVDMDVVMRSANLQIQDVLPGAQLSGIVFSSSCEDLSQLRGEIVLSFVKTQFSIPNERVVSAIASINTIQQTMDIHVKDMTDFYWSTEILDIENDSLNLNKISTKAFNQIKVSESANCDVTITRMKDSWLVRCGPLGNFVQKCQFEIHPTTGEVILPEN